MGARFLLEPTNLTKYETASTYKPINCPKHGTVGCVCVAIRNMDTKGMNSILKVWFGSLRYFGCSKFLSRKMYSFLPEQKRSSQSKDISLQTWQIDPFSKTPGWVSLRPANLRQNPTFLWGSMTSDVEPGVSLCTTVSERCRWNCIYTPPHVFFITSNYQRLT